MAERPHQQQSKGAAPIVVALDGMGEAQAMALARMLRGRVWGHKVNDLLLRAGREVIPRLKAYGKVFCDAKLHDIPHTVAHQVRVLEEAGADLITLHCSGGAEMLRAAVEARRGDARLLGVTVLTALSEESAQAVYGRSSGEQVRRLSILALQCGLDGIVCSPTDLEIAADVDPQRRLLRVTPGVRPRWYGEPDDQQRVLAPADAIRAGADLLVVGRPITNAEDQEKACDLLVEELSA
ncbi:MAG: orotidine-5'-phosphate decarboxylase [SAR324 cluster bacterium]|nr:orotidine-5'-phosphate decarboxylase [SAR324 cluster bacterium]MCZ6556157.1 orotidine-5'-phosphate decarboxylase [SAR324 cluster bacterium]MCZ6628582.1 orotidine-5'-phosphate decarboxylase [SAR324 cluster bacterium]MCZ6841329.1 orotidine-5'-phosphate decarboxylase [SAR324 cluster bacterium]